MFSKKIVAAAALLALAVGAQAQVKVYGQLDMSVGKFKSFDQETNNLKGVTKVESGVMSTGSFIGFAGTEDLGGGLKAHFVLESHIGADTGSAGANLQDNFKEEQSNQFWSRSSHVALTGSFGKVALGQYDGLLYTMLTNYSPFGDSQVFAPSQVLHYGSSLLAAGLDDLGTIGQGTSWVNSVTYETPNMAGFTAAVQFSPKENSYTADDIGSTNAAANKDNLGLAVNYAAGPLNVSAVYSKTGENFNAYFTNGGYTEISGIAGTVKTIGLASSYDFGVATLSGEYTKSKLGNQGFAYSTKFYQVGATVPVTANSKVMVAVGRRSFDSVDYYGSTAPKLKQFSLGYEHNLSKRTSVYAAAGNLKYSQGNTSVKSTNYAFGIKHNF
jgi:predicted porin